MVVSVVAKVELNPVDRSGESSGWRVGRHRRSGVGTQVGGLVGGENEWLGGVHPSFSDLFCVVVERDVAAFRESSAVIGELHADLMRALRDLPRGLGGELLEPEQVVDEGRFAVFGIEAPAAKPAALGDDRSVWRFVCYGDLGGDGEGLVLDAQHAGFR